MASIAYRELKRPAKLRRYQHVYSNVKMSIPGLTFIDNECIGRYQLDHALILIDEATLFADSRAYKEFDKQKLSFFLQHRHYKCDIILFTQQWDGVDRKIRVITDRVYYVYKGLFLGRWFSCFYRIPYGIIIPDKRSNGGQLGEIIQGYSKPPLMVRLMATKVFRPFYYRFFDSFEAPELPPLPDRYVPYRHKVVAELEPEAEPVVDQTSDAASSDEVDPQSVSSLDSFKL